MSNQSFRFSLRTAFIATLFTATMMLINVSCDPLAAVCIDVLVLFGLAALGLHSYQNSTTSEQALKRHQDLADFFILLPLSVIVVLFVYGTTR